MYLSPQRAPRVRRALCAFAVLLVSGIGGAAAQPFGPTDCMSPAERSAVDPEYREAYEEAAKYGEEVISFPDDKDLCLFTFAFIEAAATGDTDWLNAAASTATRPFGDEMISGADMVQAAVEIVPRLGPGGPEVRSLPTSCFECADWLSYTELAVSPGDDHVVELHLSLVRDDDSQIRFVGWGLFD